MGVGVSNYVKKTLQKCTVQCYYRYEVVGDVNFPE